MSNRVYTAGEKPVSPIFLDVVRIISDVQAEPAPEPAEAGAEPAPVWSYVVDETLTYPEYIKRMNEEHEEALAEIDAAIFELAAGEATE